MVKDLKVRGSLDCGDHEKVEFRITRAGRKAQSRIVTPGFRRADFGLLRDLLGRIPWETDTERSGPEELVVFQGSSKTSSKFKNGPPHMQEVEQDWQEAFIEEQLAPDDAQM